MMGEGIGRYGSVQLPDFAFSPTGGIKPLTEVTALAGVIGHPTPALDTYLYAGYEGVRRNNANNTAYGYGDFNLVNSNCNVENGTCSAQTSNVWQITAGGWEKLYQGDYGRVQIGLQGSITRRNAFSDSFGTAPHAYEDIVMTSLRFYPQ